MAAALELLPAELVGAIAEILPLSDFKNLRLTSQSLATLTRPFLALATFDGVPWKNDAARLFELSRIPECAGRIRSVDFYFSRLTERLDYDDSAYYSFTPSDWHDMLKKDWARYYETQQEAKRNGPFRLELFGAALANLPALAEVCLTWTRCPWKDPKVEKIFDPDVSVDLTRDSMLDIQQLALNTLWKLDIPLASLCIEPMVLHDLTLPKDAPLPKKLFSSLEHFHIEAIAELFLPARLEFLLSHMTKLTSLCVQFIGSDRIHLEPDFLPNTHLPNLRSLNLSCVEFSLDSFSKFLTRHSPTMNELHLVGATAIVADDGMPSVNTWDDIFRQIRREIPKLQAVSIRGTFAHQRGTSIVFIHEDDPRHKSVPPEVWDVPSKTIESWLLKGGDYPELPWERGMVSLEDIEYEVLMENDPAGMFDPQDLVD